MLLARVRLLVVTLWAGSVWTIGYLVAPTAFASFERTLAGSVAASMFHSAALLSIGCALALLVLLWVAKDLDATRVRRLSVVVLAMLACTLVSHIGLQPLMGALREAAGPGGVMEPAAREQFRTLHAISSVIYLIQSLLAGYLVLAQPGTDLH